MKRLSISLAILTLWLIFVGALVKSHDAGLSVPDWPQSYGYNMFTFPVSMWIGGIMYEHGHRLFASAVGFLTLILFIVTQLREARRPLRILSGLALLAVILQGVLGGLTVWLQLPLLVSTAHALLAQTFFLIILTIAYLYCSVPKTEPLPRFSIGKSSVVKLGIVIISAIYLQLLFGALMRHSEAALAVPDFPTVGGEFLPKFDSQMFDHINHDRDQLNLLPVTSAQVVAHLLHRYWAFILLFLQIFWIVRIRSENPKNRDLDFSRPIFLVGLTLVLQMILGIYTVWSGRDPWLTSLHVVTGATLLGLSFILLLRTGLIRT